MPDTRVARFLTKAEEQEIVEAILEAERNTSGEIRVHIEGACGGNPMARAQELFYLLKMDNTKNNNGVLIYVAIHDRKFAIYGDIGINKAVPEGFWDETRDILQSHFKESAFSKGLVKGILKAGKALKSYFPWNPTDINELGNEISKG
jgi:uncharacterized membrane protein